MRRERPAFCRYSALFPEAAGGDSNIFSELPAEMLCVLISAGSGGLRNTLVRIDEKVSCLAEPAFNNVIHTGDSEFLFVKQLQMSRADMQQLCHFPHIPGKLRIIYDLPSQHQKLMVMGRGGVMQYILPKL